MLCFDLQSGTDQVYWVPYLGMSDEDALLRYETFEDVAAAVLKSAEPGAAGDGEGSRLSVFAVHSGSVVTEHGRSAE
jgi:hypothetical protein